MGSQIAFVFYTQWNISVKIIVPFWNGIVNIWFMRIHVTNYFLSVIIRRNPMYLRYRQYGPGIWTFKAWLNLIVTLQNSVDTSRVFSFNIWSMVLMLFLSAICRSVSCYVPTEIALYISMAWTEIIIEKSPKNTNVCKLILKNYGSVLCIKIYKCQDLYSLSPEHET